MTREHKDKFKKYFIITLSVMTWLHIGVLYYYDVLDLKQLTKSAPKEKEKRLRVVLRQRDSQPKQIVTSEKSKNKKKDPKAKFLSKNNQTFDRQTTARKTGAFKQAGKGEKDGKKRVSQKKKVASPSVNKPTVVKPKMAMKRKRKGRKKITFADLNLGMQALKRKPKKAQMRNPAKALGLKHGQKKAIGLSANNDFVEDIPLGDMTKLNTVEYKYYGFYHRIKQKLEQYWGRSIQKKAQALWRSGRRFPASGNKITSLIIQLDSMGNIVKINVKGSSGVRELDSAAIESFNRAGPFPNPPRGMVKNGLATIEWGFVVKS